MKEDIANQKSKAHKLRIVADSPTAQRVAVYVEMWCQGSLGWCEVIAKTMHRADAARMQALFGMAGVEWDKLSDSDLED